MAATTLRTYYHYASTACSPGSPPDWFRHYHVYWWYGRNSRHDGSDLDV